MKAEQAGLVWIKDEQRYFVEHRVIKSRKDIRRVEVKINGQKHKVTLDKIRRWPQIETADGPERAPRVQESFLQPTK